LKAVCVYQPRRIVEEHTAGMASHIMSSSPNIIQELQHHHVQLWQGSLHGAAPSLLTFSPRLLLLSCKLLIPIIIPWH
jgi:hypothetical protein